jgi:hypothetical protein
VYLIKIRSKPVVLACLATLGVVLAFCSALIQGMAPALALENITLDRLIFVSSPKWHFLRQRALAQDILLFRKYSFPVIDDKMKLDDISTVTNSMMYGCQRTARYSDYVQFEFPTWIELKGIDSNSWISQIDLRIAIDKRTFTAVGEYRNRELAVDLNDTQKDNLLRLLVSEETVIEFGPNNERLTLYQKYRTPSGGNIVGFMDDIVQQISSILKSGKVESMEEETMLERCSNYKRTGRY